MGKHEQVPGNAVRNELLGFVRAADEKSAMACRGPVSDAPSGGGHWVGRDEWLAKALAGFGGNDAQSWLAAPRHERCAKPIR
jgi:hypothetical protein